MLLVSFCFTPVGVPACKEVSKIIQRSVPRTSWDFPRSQDQLRSWKAASHLSGSQATNHSPSKLQIVVTVSENSHSLKAWSKMLAFSEIYVKQMAWMRQSDSSRDGFRSLGGPPRSPVLRVLSPFGFIRASKPKRAIAIHLGLSVPSVGKYYGPERCGEEGEALLKCLITTVPFSGLSPNWLEMNQCPLPFCFIIVVFVLCFHLLASAIRGHKAGLSSEEFTT